MSILILSCSNDSSDNGSSIEIEEVSIIVDSENKEVFENISETPQIFEINNKRDTFLQCNNGTIISIPQNCFVNNEGEIVTENIKLEIVEALSISDYLRYDLQTTSGENLLQSGGMVYINAKFNNDQLALNEGTSINVELPSNVSSPEFKIFNGNHDDQGNIDWTETGSIDNRMIPLPLSELNHKIYTAYRFTDTVSWIHYMDSIMINNPKYENTFIATTEFEQRLAMLMPDASQYWEGHVDYMKNPKFDVWENVMTPDNVTLKIICEPVNIYLNNIDKPMYYSDSLVYDFLLKKSNQDSIYYWKSDRTHKDQWNSRFGYYPLSYFERKMKEKLTQPIQFDSRGVDMTLPNAKDLLVQTGYSSAHAFEQIILKRRIDQIISERQEKKRIQEERVENQNKINKAYTVAFEVNQLGWVNVDRFLNDEFSEEVVFNVNITSNPVEYCDLTLILPQRNVAINGLKDNYGNYSFTTKGGNYRKLPIGESAIIIAISASQGKPFFAIEKLKIQKEQNVKLILESITWKEVDSELVEMNKKPNREG